MYVCHDIVFFFLRYTKFNASKGTMQSTKQQTSIYKDQEKNASGDVELFQPDHFFQRGGVFWAETSLAVGGNAMQFTPVDLQVYLLKRKC